MLSELEIISPDSWSDSNSEDETTCAPLPSDNDIRRVAHEAVQELVCGFSKYHTFECAWVRLMLRKSSVPRRGDHTLDVDIVQVELHCPLRHGVGTQLVLNLALEAFSLRTPRGLYIEQAITPASEGLLARLVLLGEATYYRDRHNALCRLPPSTTDTSHSE